MTTQKNDDDVILTNYYVFVVFTLMDNLQQAKKKGWGGGWGSWHYEVYSLKHYPSNETHISTYHLICKNEILGTQTLTINIGPRSRNIIVTESVFFHATLHLCTQICVKGILQFQIMIKYAMQHLIFKFQTGF